MDDSGTIRSFGRIKACELNEQEISHISGGYGCDPHNDENIVYFNDSGLYGSTGTCPFPGVPDLFLDLD